jgi:hypothetical protein
MLRNAIRALVVGAVLVGAAGCLGRSAWEYRLDGISSEEMEQVTVAEYLRLKGKSLDQIQRMKLDDVEKARKEMGEAVGKDNELTGKLRAFSGWYLIQRLNLRGADGWELVQTRPEGGGLIFLFKRRGRAKDLPSLLAGSPGAPGAP